MYQTVYVLECVNTPTDIYSHLYIHPYKMVNHRTLFKYILCSVIPIAKTVWEGAQNIPNNCFAVSSQ